MENLQGTCLCGAVSIEIMPKNHDIHACHCEIVLLFQGKNILRSFHHQNGLSGGFVISVVLLCFTML
ncbi:hypothetical protein KKC_00542 [Listeria fleischmannii subsp. coloradonensis]|nr:hypothetical protein KKC_00542 [Listeria fleischmannii subsp. coloradonensis]